MLKYGPLPVIGGIIFEQVIYSKKNIFKKENNINDD